MVEEKARMKVINFQHLRNIKSSCKHSWSIEAQYESENSCKFGRLCHKCGKLADLYQYKHIWGDEFYGTENSCALAKRCQRCGEIKKLDKVRHQWSDWNYESKESCQFVRSCQRCKKNEQKQAEHLWSDWREITISSDTDCSIKQRKCQRCHHVDKISASHKWITLAEQWKSLDLHLQKKCTQCGYIKKETQRICPECGENRIFRIQEDSRCVWYCISCDQSQLIAKPLFISFLSNNRNKKTALYGFDKIEEYIEEKRHRKEVSEFPRLWDIMRWIQCEIAIYGRLQQSIQQEIGKVRVNDIYTIIGFNDTIMNLQHRQVKALSMEGGGKTSFNVREFVINFCLLSPEVRIEQMAGNHQNMPQIVHSYIVLSSLPGHKGITVKEDRENLSISKKSSYNFRENSRNDEELKTYIGIKDHNKAEQLAVAFSDLIHQLTDKAECG